MKILRTDPSCFEQLTDFPFKEHYLEFEGKRMHYLDEGQGEVILALHGEPTWSYLYRKFIPGLTNYRFIAPDFIGFGKSDKIVGWRNYSFSLHLKSLENFIEQLDLQDITLIVQDWGGLLGLALLAEHPKKFKRVVILNTALPTGKPLPLPFKLWQAYARYHPSLPAGKLIQFGTYSKVSKEVQKAYDAPFPNRKYKDGARAFPQLIPSKPTHEAVDHMKKAREVLSGWTKPCLIMFSDKDRIMSGLIHFFKKLIPESDHKQTIIIRDAGHFLQEEKGEELSNHIDHFMKTTG